MVLAGKTLSSAGHRQATDERAATRVLRGVTVRPRCATPAEHAGMTKWLTGRANSAGPRAKMLAQHCADIFLISDFCLIFEKIVENSKMYRKYYTTRKNMKQISIDSLRADLHREICLTLFYSIMYCTKLQELKY
jgi:hypothetical protein